MCSFGTCVEVCRKAERDTKVAEWHGDYQKKVNDEQRKHAGVFAMRTLSKKFADRESFAANWCAATGGDGYAKRHVLLSRVAVSSAIECCTQPVLPDSGPVHLVAPVP